MLRVDPSLFSNVITTVQRTGSLTGGSVSGLPNGVVIQGLQGVTSFGSDIAEAQKEFNLGRVRSSLERVKQLEMQFNGIAGRWNSTVGSVISSARQGRQQLSLQKLNEVKNAQARMQQLTAPASKAFRDLVSALEHAVAMEGRTAESPPQDDVEAEDANPEQNVAEKVPARGSDSAAAPAGEHDTPDRDLLGPLADKYRFGARLEVQRGPDNKARVVPKLESDRFYFVAGFDPPRVVRIRDIRRRAVLVLDTSRSRELLIEAAKLKTLIRNGIWVLDPRG